mmetsp:Transcript_100499/g.279906  ORF Transcript_100499/g.279906 Transcript_100499/m.279906 type:complete len:296 (+) Transcript_100499:810-1697(+)
MGHLPEDARGPDPLVLHRQLPNDRALSHRHGGHDPPAHPAPRHRQVQRHVGRGHRRGDGLEVGAWRCFSKASALQGPGCVRRLRPPAPGLCLRDPRVLGCWFPVTSAPRVHSSGHVVALDLRWNLRGLHVGTVLQDVEGRGLEEDNLDDCLPLPRNGVWDVLCPQPLHLGHEVVGGRALHHDVCAASSLVRDFSSTGLPGSLLRLQKGSCVPARPHEPDPAPDPCPAVVHQWGLFLDDRGHPAVRRRFHRAVLHNVLYLAAPVLLSVRLPDACDPHSDRHLCRDINHPHLLPADQ